MVLPISAYKFDDAESSKNTRDAFEQVPDLFGRAPGPEIWSRGLGPENRF